MARFGRGKCALTAAAVLQSAAAFTGVTPGHPCARARALRIGAAALQCSAPEPGGSAGARRRLLQASALAVLNVFSQAAEAVPFGLGDANGGTGWGEAQKAGVKWGGGFSNPLSDGGDNFQAELVNGKGNPVIVGFQKPKGWKVSTNTGIAVQNYVTAESAYVLVAPAGADDVEEVSPQYVLDKVSSTQRMAWLLPVFYICSYLYCATDMLT
jgi:hypothetical protein